MNQTSYLTTLEETEAELSGENSDSNMGIREPGAKYAKKNNGRRVVCYFHFSFFSSF